jgi:hypothetical protein
VDCGQEFNGLIDIEVVYRGDRRTIDPAQEHKTMVAVERDNVGHGIEFVLSHQSQSIDLSSEAIVRVVQPRWVLLQRKG